MEIKTNHTIVRGLSLFLFILLVGSGCFLFDTALKLKVMFDDPNGLKKGAVVVYAYREQAIGKITEIEALNSGDVIVHAKIAPDYKGLVRTGALFVIENPLFDKTKPARLVMDVLPKDMNNPPIESGTLVKGVSWAYYQMAVSAAAVGPAIDSLIKQSRRFIAEIEALVQSGEIDRLVEELKAETERIAELTRAQRKDFVENILPELERQVADVLKKLEQSRNQTDRDNLQKEFDGLKQTLNQ